MEKKQSRFLSVVLIMSVTLLLPRLLIAEDWERAEEKDGIIVYTREAPDSKVKEFRVQMVVEASLDSLVAVIDDLPG